MKYTIHTKQKNYLTGLVHNSKNEVMDAIIFYDLLPPFKVFDESNCDVTDDIVSKLIKLGYKFVDKKKVAANIPAGLQKLMNNYYRNTIILKDVRDISIKLTTVKDIKSIKGFYELWDNNAITIGMAGTKILFLDVKNKSICSISKSNLKDLSKKDVLEKSVDAFVKKINDAIV